MDDLDRLGAVSDRGLEWAEAFLHEYRQRVGESFELEWALSTVGAGAPGDAQAAGTRSGCRLTYRPSQHTRR